MTILRSVTSAVLAFCAAPAFAAGPDVSRMTLIFDDEFDGTTLDLNRWQVGTEPNGLQWGSSSYFATLKDKDLFDRVYRVSDGVLTIRATYDEAFVDPVPWKQKWFSGMISTAFSDGRPPSATFRRGCVEIRQKLPDGKGVWPANWALNMASMQKGGDPLGQLELDGLEEYGYNPHRFHSGLIDWSNKDTKSNNVGAWTNSPDLTAEFHVYDYCLDDRAMTVFLDGVVTASLPLYRPDTMDKVYWMFNLAMGSGWPITVPPSGSYDMEIDYVRIWSADPDASASVKPLSP